FLSRFFSLLRLRLPSSLLFPYTTLFRSRRRFAVDSGQHRLYILNSIGCSAHDECVRSLISGQIGGKYLPNKPLGRDLTKAFHCLDRKSTRLNSSHGSISYAVFCLKKKNS